MNVTALVAANCRSAKIESGSIGEAALRSLARKAASPTTPSAAIAITQGDDQPSVGASMKANVMPVRNTTPVSAPSTSILPVALGSRDSGTCRAAIAMTTAAIGRLMKNIQRHDAAEIR